MEFIIRGGKKVKTQVSQSPTSSFNPPYFSNFKSTRNGNGHTIFD